MVLYLAEPETLGELIPDEPPYRAGQLRRWLYRTPVLETAAMTNLPEPLRERFAEHLYPFTVEITSRRTGGRPASGCSGPPAAPPSRRC